MLHDIAVAGLGTMGSAIAATCAQRGASVIGLEQFPRCHAFGSFVGRSRMIRKAYFEDPAYVPLLLRAYDLWHELERESDMTLLQRTGLLMVGRAESEIIAGATRAARKHGLPFDSLSAGDIRRRYPMLKVLEDEVGVYEPDGGVLDPERAVEAQLRVAEKGGAQLCFSCALQSWEARGEGFVVKLAEGCEVSCRTLVLSLGPWFGQVLSQLGVSFSVQRNLQAWFRSATPAYASPEFPPFLIDRLGLPAPLYGFPDLGHGVKAAFHAYGAMTHPNEVDREIDMASDIKPIQRAMKNWMPGAAETLLEAKVCMYSLTPDGHFVVDRHPEHSQLIVCGGFSGHGFKFAPVIGEIAADLALRGSTHHDIDFLSLRRFYS